MEKTDVHTGEIKQKSGPMHVNMRDADLQDEE